MIKHRIFWQRLTATMQYTNSDYYYTHQRISYKFAEELHNACALYFAWWLGWLNQFLLMRIGGTCGF